MSPLFYFILAVQLASVVVMTLLILIQHGKGADAGTSFGGGGSASLFGAQGAGTALSRATAILAAVFFASTLAMSFVGNTEDSVFKSAAPASAAPAPAASGPLTITTTPAAPQIPASGNTHAAQ